MGTYEDLKQAISAVIKENNNQEITGEIMQSALLSIINNVGANATFAGIATPATAPGSPDANIFYLAGEPGNYVNFGGVTVQSEVAILENSSGIWKVKNFGAATVKAVRDEQTRALTAETEIKNTTEKSCVSNNEALNNAVRELYFDKWFDMSQIKSVAISRKVLQGNTDVWEMYFISTDNSWAHAHFSVDPSVENDDICVGTIATSDDTHPLYNKEIKVYAVIYWGLIAQNKQVIYTNVSLKYHTFLVKFHPIINHCIETHKYVHTIRGIKAIKELYIEDLKKNGVSVSKESFEKYFVVQNITRNVVDGVSVNYQIAISDIREKNKHGTNGDKSEYIYIASYDYTDENNVFYLDKTINPSKPSSDGILTGNTYSYKIYAVIDWSLMGKTAEGNYYYAITSQMLAGCLDKKNSPIIYNYIETEKLKSNL